MFIIIPLSLSSTSSNDQNILPDDCAISNAEVATPPAFAAFAGRNTTPLFIKTSIASKEEGIFAPSATYLTPFLTRSAADSASISFCVAQGSATSQGIDQIPLQPSLYIAPLTLSAYSLILPRLTSFISFITSSFIPAES